MAGREVVVALRCIDQVGNQCAIHAHTYEQMARNNTVIGVKGILTYGSTLHIIKLKLLIYKSM